MNGWVLCVKFFWDKIVYILGKLVAKFSFYFQMWSPFLICIITHKLELVDLVVCYLLHFGKYSLLIPKIKTCKLLHVFTKTIIGFKVSRTQRRRFLHEFGHHLRFINIINIQNLTLLTPLLIMLTLLTSSILMFTLITLKILLMIEL